MNPSTKPAYAAAGLLTLPDDILELVLAASSGPLANGRVGPLSTCKTLYANPELWGATSQFQIGRHAPGGWLSARKSVKTAFFEPPERDGDSNGDSGDGDGDGGGSLSPHDLAALRNSAVGRVYVDQPHAAHGCWIWGELKGLGLTLTELEICNAHSVDFHGMHTSLPTLRRLTLFGLKTVANLLPRLRSLRLDCLCLLNTDMSALCGPAKSAESTGPVELAERAGPLGLAEPVDPMDSAEPTEPVELAESTDPVELTASSEAVEHVEPVEPVGLTKFVEPVGLTDLVGSAGLAISMELAESVGPMELAESVEPVGPVGLAELAELDLEPSGSINLAFLRGMRRLVSLHIGYSFGEGTISATDIGAIATLSATLSRLSLPSSTITDAGLSALVRSGMRLKYLSLANCKHITAAGIALLAGMPLEILDLRRTGINLRDCPPQLRHCIRVSLCD